MCVVEQSGQMIALDVVLQAMLGGAVYIDESRHRSITCSFDNCSPVNRSLYIARLRSVRFIMRLAISPRLQKRTA